MSQGQLSSQRLSRRKWAVLMAAVPAMAQTASTVPPQGSPEPAAATASAADKAEKAKQDVKSNGQRLAAMEIPMNVEPAFTFRA